MEAGEQVRDALTILAGFVIGGTLGTGAVYYGFEAGKDINRDRLETCQSRLTSASEVIESCQTLKESCDRMAQNFLDTFCPNGGCPEQFKENTF